MKKEMFLIFYNLALWGIAGFFVTLLFGFLACCTNVSHHIFYASLIIFAFVGLSISFFCIVRGCKKLKKDKI